MRIAVVYFARHKREKMMEVSRGLARGFESAGHRVDIIDGFLDPDTRLATYEYIAMGCESLSLFTGKISGQIPVFLSNSGTLTGKRCFAFTIRQPFASLKALARLMKSMEKEGMLLKYSDILLSPGQAEVVGKNLGSAPDRRN